MATNKSPGVLPLPETMRSFLNRFRSLKHRLLHEHFTPELKHEFDLWQREAAEVVKEMPHLKATIDHMEVQLLSANPEIDKA